VSNEIKKERTKSRRKEVQGIQEGRKSTEVKKEGSQRKLRRKEVKGS
jgi:hypothetical protein